MLRALAAAALLASSSAAVADTLPERAAAMDAYNAYSTCVSNHAVDWAVGHDAILPADLVRHAEEFCEPQWGKFRDAMRSGTRPSAQDAEVLETLRATARRDAISEVAAARCHC